MQFEPGLLMLSAVPTLYSTKIHQW